MTSEGLKSLFPIEDISVMGIWELLPHLYRINVSFVLITTLLVFCLGISGVFN
jgi:lipid A disaccharide synthetase